MNTDLNEKLKQYQRNYYASKKKNKLNTKFLYRIKMNEKALQFNDVVVNKKEFHASKQAIASNSAETGRIVVSGEFKYSYDGSKYFTGYLHGDNIIRPLCIMLPQMSGYIKF